MALKAIGESDLSDASNHDADVANETRTVTPASAKPENAQKKPAKASCAEEKPEKLKASCAEEKPEELKASCAEEKPEKLKKEQKGPKAAAKTGSKVLKKPSAKAAPMKKPSASSKEIRTVGKNWYKRDCVTGILLHYTDGTKQEVLRVKPAEGVEMEKMKEIAATCHYCGDVKCI